jgi:putative SOS response-associated peptidase YedK
MFDRYSLASSAEQIQEFFSVDPHGFERPRYNAAPAQLLPIITIGSAGLSHFYWGTAPEWSKNKPIGEKIINIRLEQINERPAIKKQVKKNRCIIPADGFYGWKKVGKKTSIPYRFELRPRSLFAIAGTWEEYDDEDGNMIHTFMAITVPAGPIVIDICERMPAILSKEEIGVWMNADTTEEQLMTCLHPFEGKLESFPVSPRINDVRNDEATMILPTPPSDQFGNLTLFN